MIGRILFLTYAIALVAAMWALPGHAQPTGEFASACIAERTMACIAAIGDYSDTTCETCEYLATLACGGE